MLIRPLSRIYSRSFSQLRNHDFSGLLRSGKLKIHEEVASALNSGHALSNVVALESAIITHGIPSPDNLHLALELENIVRLAGAVPATIAVIDGRIHVGLSAELTSRLADKDQEHSKLSRRDLAFALSRNITGGTTCAATMCIADACGIDIFATGGLGGVHKGGHTSK